MPLLDHFHPPLSEYRNWEGLHAAWANAIVAQLNEELLPPRYFAEPLISWGRSIEIDVATIEYSANAGSQGAATAIWSPSKPAISAPFEFAGQDTAEVRIISDEAGPRLVAAIELVNPRNKDRAVSRQALVRKCAAYLQERVGLVIVDVVTSRKANFHEEILQLLQIDRQETRDSSGNYAAAYRVRGSASRAILEAWPEILRIGEDLPTLPLWLSDDLSLPLDLEATYTAACRSLRISK